MLNSNMSMVTDTIGDIEFTVNVSGTMSDVPHSKPQLNVTLFSVNHIVRQGNTVIFGNKGAQIYNGKIKFLSHFLLLII